MPLNQGEGVDMKISEVNTITEAKGGITEKQKAEAQLQKSELFYRNLIADSIDGILLTDPEGLISFASPSITQILGYDAEETPGKNAFGYVHPDDFQLASSAFAAEVKGESLVKFVNIRLLKKTGEWIYCIVRGHNMLHNPYVGCMVIYYYDDTLRKNAEDALIENEKKLRSQATVLQNVTDIIVTADLNLVITSWNKVTEELTGIPAKEAVGKTYREVITLDYSPYSGEEVRDALFNKGIWKGEVSFVDRFGVKQIHLETFSLLYDELGNKVGILVVAKDITERKKIQDKLKESEQRFRHLIHHLNLGVLLVNEKGQVLVCNQAAFDLLGVTEKELIGKTLLDLDWSVIHEDGSTFPPSDYPIVIAIRSGRSVKDIVMGVHQIGSDKRIWLLVNTEVVTDNNDNIFHVICSFTDITEQKYLSQQLIQQEIQKQKQLIQATIDGQEKERLEIGKELHDNISQHLTTTRLYMEVAKEKASGEILEMITYAHNNLTDIINEIRQLSQSLVPSTLGDLGLIESIQDLCGPLIRTHAFNIEFHHRHFNENELPGNMKLMLFRVIQEQINNIVRHAYASQIVIRLLTDAEQIILSISDNGKGFDLINNKKGLGLTNINNRASLFDGKAVIDTEPGKGCTITVTIPVVKEP